MHHPFKAAAIVGVGFLLASFAPLPGFSTAALDALDPSRLAGLSCGAQRAGSALAQNLLVATVMGSIMQALFPGEPIYTMAFAAVTLALALLAMTRVRQAAPDLPETRPAA